MNMKHTSSATLFSESRSKLLTLLFVGNSERHFRDITRLSRLGQGAIQRELARMVSAGLVLRRESGRQVYFRANPEHPIYPELCGLAKKLFGIEPLLRDALAPLAKKINAAFIYGSFARGTEKGESDVDVMVIGELSLRSLVSVVKPVAQQTGREINPTIYSAAEYCKRLNEKQHFLTALQKEPKLFLIGDADELGRLAK